MTIRSTLTTVACLAMLTPAAIAATYTVSPGQSIQQTIQYAADGDTIRVQPGTYYEQINFAGKAITIESAAGADQTILDASPFDAGSVVTFVNDEDSDSRLIGFTIRGGKGTPRGTSVVGGGVYIRNAGPTIQNCVFADNTAGGGGGFAQVNGWGTIDRCTFTGNTSTADEPFGGGALYATFGTLTVTNCQFDSNAATGPSIGGAMSFHFTLAEVANCLIANNTSTSWGGGVFNAYGQVKLVNCTLVGNDAGLGGGGCFTKYSSSNTTIANSIFWQNTAGIAHDELCDFGSATSVVLNCNLGWDASAGEYYSIDPKFDASASVPFTLLAGSPCIDAGDNSYVPTSVEVDLSEYPRFVDDPGTPNAGSSGDSRPNVDLGVYEFQGQSPPDEDPPLPCPDMNGDGEINVFDLLDLLAAFGDECSGCPGDANADGFIDVFDLIHLLESWGSCEP